VPVLNRMPTWTVFLNALSESSSPPRNMPRRLATSVSFPFSYDSKQTTSYISKARNGVMRTLVLDSWAHFPATYSLPPPPPVAYLDSRFELRKQFLKRHIPR
jgi:hypothetical protein